MVLCTPHSKLWKYNSLVACEAYTIVLAPLVIRITLKVVSTQPKGRGRFCCCYVLGV